MAATTLLLIVTSCPLTKAQRDSTTLASAILLAICVNDVALLSYWRYYPPVEVVQLSDELVLRRFSGGFAGADWEGVTIAEQPRRLRLLEKVLYTRHIGHAGDCNETSVRIWLDSASRMIHVECGNWSEDVKVSR